MAFPVSNIRKRCKEKGMTLAELERKLGFGNGVIARWEKAKTSPPLDRLSAIAEELDTSLEELSKEEKEVPVSTEANGDDADFLTLYHRANPLMQRLVVKMLKDAESLGEAPGENAKG